jgi:hypothetical protein
MRACLRGSFYEPDQEINIEVVKLLLDGFPDALTMIDNDDDTPLHLRYKNDETTQKVVKLLVDRGGAKALGMINNHGATPLHVACGAGYSEAMIELMIERYPKALEIVNKRGGTVLHRACFYNVPAETLRIMINRGPAACLVLANSVDAEPNLPYDLAIKKERDAPVVELLSSATKDAACAVIECALSSRTAMPAPVTNHVREMLTTAIPGFNESGPTEAVRDQLEPDLIKSLATNTELQELLKNDEGYHCLIHGLVRMNKSGRSIALQNPSNTTAGLSVLACVSDNVDCMFLHLRENPSLCNRHCGRGRKRKAPI